MYIWLSGQTPPTKFLISVIFILINIIVFIPRDNYEYYLLALLHKTAEWDLGAVSIRKTVLPGMAIPMLKIRRPNGRLIFNMELTIRR